MPYRAFIDKVPVKVLSIVFFVFVLAPVVGPEVTKFWDMVRGRDFESRQASMKTMERQIIKLEGQVDKLIAKIETQDRQITVLEYQQSVDRAAFYEAKVAIWVLKYEGKQLRLDDFNPAFANMILVPEGIDPEVARGKTWHELFPKDQADAYVADDLAVFEGNNTSTNNQLYTLRRNGTRQYWQVIKWKVTVDGKGKGLQGIAAKISTPSG